MTDDPRRPKPLFRVFDRDPDRHRPVDGDYVQSAYIRLHRPGPWRTALVVVLAFTTAWASLAVVLAVPAVMSEGRGVQVETAEDEPFVLGVEAVPSPGGVVDERVAFEQTGELLVAQVATARGAASGQAVPLDLSGPP